MNLLLVTLGAALLYGGGELLVRHATRLAGRLGVSSLAIGLTVVAFGTSAPELAATLASALEGAPDLGVGNVIGSNLANVGLILGLAALLAPLATTSGFVRREVPLAAGVTLLLVPLAWGGTLGRVEGAGLLGLLALYLWLLFRNDAVPDAELPGEDDAGADRDAPAWRSVLGAVLGVALLVAGAHLLVEGAVAVAERLGVPERVIGLTLVAFGTSLPELASSLVAALRGQTDLILGNVVGSNVFNVLAVLGATALVRPLPVDLSAVAPDLAAATLLAAALLPLMARGARLGRAGGALLLVAYLGYVAFLFA